MGPIYTRSCTFHYYVSVGEDMDVLRMRMYGIVQRGNENVFVLFTARICAAQLRKYSCGIECIGLAMLKL